MFKDSHPVEPTEMMASLAGLAVYATLGLGWGDRAAALMRESESGRKVRAPQGRVLGNAQAGRPDR